MKETISEGTEQTEWKTEKQQENIPEKTDEKTEREILNGASDRWCGIGK